MKIKQVLYSSKFLKNLQKLPVELKPLIDKRMEMFKSECFDPRLKTHKLKGKWKDCWSFSINYSYRIVFEFKNNDGDVGFVDVGNHSIYQ